MDSMSEMINEMYQQNCREILQSYQKAGVEIDAVYRELLEAFCWNSEWDIALCLI
jgi:hypothetical protein